MLIVLIGWQKWKKNTKQKNKKNAQKIKPLKANMFALEKNLFGKFVDV